MKATGSATVVHSKFGSERLSVSVLKLLYLDLEADRKQPRRDSKFVANLNLNRDRSALSLVAIMMDATTRLASI